jgi:hypothetical protein
MRTTPHDTSRNVQQTAYLSVLIASKRVAESCLRMLETQQRTLAVAHRRRRADECGGKPKCPGGAADLQYHYGRRCRDVDVERL